MTEFSEVTYKCCFQKHFYCVTNIFLGLFLKWYYVLPLPWSWNLFSTVDYLYFNKLCFEQSCPRLLRHEHVLSLVHIWLAWTWRPLYRWWWALASACVIQLMRISLWLSTRKCGDCNHNANTMQSKFLSHKILSCMFCFCNVWSTAQKL